MRVRAYRHRLKEGPCWHLDRRCEAIDEVPDEVITAQVFASLRALGRHRVGRPCRRCALEAVLADALARPVGQREVFVAVSGQGAGNAHGPREVSSSGAARLRRVAATAGLEVAETAGGPVAFGVLTAPTAALLASNLRTLVAVPVPSPLPGASCVAAAWSLAADRTGVGGWDPCSGPWRLAAALTAGP